MTLYEPIESFEIVSSNLSVPGIDSRLKTTMEKTNGKQTMTHDDDNYPDGSSLQLSLLVTGNWKRALCFVLPFTYHGPR